MYIKNAFVILQCKARYPTILKGMAEGPLKTIDGKQLNSYRSLPVNKNGNFKS